jgi:hypothetical protein
VQSVYITSNVVSSNPVQGYLMQHYVIKSVNDLRNVCVGSPGTTVSSRSKTDRCNIAEILLKVALNTITLAQLDNRRNKGKLYTPITHTHDYSHS